MIADTYQPSSYICDHIYFSIYILFKKKDCIPSTIDGIPTNNVTPKIILFESFKFFTSITDCHNVCLQLERVPAVQYETVFLNIY